MLGIVTSCVPSNSFWYKACTHCLSKFDEDDRECSRCGCTLTMLQYRLCLEFETEHGCLLVTVFGNALNQLFGSSPDLLKQRLQCALCEEAKNILHRAVEDCFIGFTFEMYLKSNGNCMLKVSTDNPCFVATEIKRVGSHNVGSVCDRLEEYMRVAANKTPAVRRKSNPFLFPTSDTQGSNCSRRVSTEAAVCVRDHDSISRSLSDTLLLLEDSFIVQLIQKRNMLRSKASPSNFCRKTSGAAVGSNSFWNKSLASLHCRELGNANDCTSTSPSEWDILDEITLPVNSPLETCGKRRASSSLPLSPKVRRCRSLSPRIASPKDDSVRLDSKIELSKRHLEFSNTEANERVSLWPENKMKTTRNECRNGHKISSSVFADHPLLFSTPKGLKVRRKSHLTSSPELFSSRSSPFLAKSAVSNDENDEIDYSLDLFL